MGKLEGQRGPMGDQAPSRRGLCLCLAVSHSDWTVMFPKDVCDFVVTWPRLGAWSWLMCVICLAGHLDHG